MKKYSSDKNCLNIFRLLTLVITAILLCLCTFIFSAIPKLMIFLNILFFSAGFFLAVIYLPYYFKVLEYCLYENGELKKTSGVFFRKQQKMSLDSVQYTTSVSAPLSRFTGLNFLLLYAYGGIMTIMFVRKKDFDELISELRK